MCQDFDILEGGGEISIHGIFRRFGATLFFPLLAKKSMITLKMIFSYEGATAPLYF